MAADVLSWQSAAYAALALLAAGSGAYVYLAVRKNARPFRLLHLSQAQPGAKITLLFNSRPKGRYAAAILMRNARQPFGAGESKSLLSADIEVFDDANKRLSHAHLPPSAAQGEKRAPADMKPVIRLSLSEGFKPLTSARDIGQDAGQPAYGFLLHSFNVPSDISSGTIWMKIKLSNLSPEMEKRYGPLFLLVEETAG